MAPRRRHAPAHTHIHIHSNIHGDSAARSVGGAAGGARWGELIRAGGVGCAAQSHSCQKAAATSRRRDAAYPRHHLTHARAAHAGVGSARSRSGGISTRSITLLARIAAHGSRTALVDMHGTHTYDDLLAASLALAEQLAPLIALKHDGHRPRVAYLCPRDVSYVTAQWAIWIAGGIGVPLADSYPASEIAYFLEDAAPAALLVHPSLTRAVADVAAAAGVPLVEVPGDTASRSARGSAASTTSSSISQQAVARALHEQHPAFATSAAVVPVAGGDAAADGALLIYTSGTTSRPKGVLVTHSALQAQITALTTAWGWRCDDRILHVLPLHHVHGVMAVLLCAMWNGAAVEMLPKFDAAATWAALTRQPDKRHEGGRQLSLFMAVPTVYAKLLQSYDAQPPAVQRAWSAALRAPQSSLRLMVSGSAALPEPVFKRWQAVTGHTLLERYGMTEFGMSISNPLLPADGGGRRLNAVGLPLPGYEARIVDEADGNTPLGPSSGSVDRDAPSVHLAAVGGPAPRRLSMPECAPGELQVRGPGVFTQYWGRPQATAEAFAPGGWLRTGDLATRDADGYYHILGRISADIIKSGGYKISSLEIERVLLEHPRVRELAVLGAPDPTYGERVAALVVLRDHASHDSEAAVLAELRAWAAGKLASYKLPTVVRLLDGDIPRNAMGKVNKKALKTQFFPC